MPLNVGSFEAAMYRTVTREIEVTVTPRFLPERSSPENSYFFWAYTIAIANRGSETVQLKTRHWRITDALGRLQEVRGAGVVGEEPGARARGVVRIHERRAAADALRLHGRQLRHGHQAGRALRHRDPGLFPRQPGSPADDQLSGAADCPLSTSSGANT